jgi:hypothetical protein
MFLGVQKSVREWTLTLPSELPFWKLESQWTPKSSEGHFRGKNPLDWIVIYINEYILKRRCLKWAHMTHLDTWNTSYGQKKGRESNWQFDSRPLKVRCRPNLLVCRWCATYRWKALDKGYNFALNLISIKGLHTKWWESQLWEFWDSPLGVRGQNAIYVLVPWLGTEYTIRGKVVDSPKSGPWWVLWVYVCPRFNLAPKVLQLCTNQFIV